MVHTAKNLQSFRKPERITVQDVLGKRILKQTTLFTGNTLQLNAGNLAPGLYMLQVADSAGKITNFKFVVQ